MLITAGAVLGRFGCSVRERTMRLLEGGRVDIVASDAHNLTWRPPTLAATREVIAEQFGKAEAMVSSRPAAVLENATLKPRGGQNSPLPVVG